MTTILKKEWTIAFWFMLFMLLFIFIFGLWKLPLNNLPFIGTILLLSTLFQTDEKSKMNVYLASLPIERKIIVRGRYVLLSLFALTMVIFGLLVNKMVSVSASKPPFPLADSVLVLIILLALLSLFLPIFYRFTFNIAFLVAGGSIVLLGIGLFMLLFSNEGFLADWLTEHVFLEKYIPIALGLAILLFLLSYKISVLIFEKKELHA